ncbi:MAG: hypothetical protein GYA36_17770 [Veillonellaceae bacterium]|nr:hypothetical protein [Veillonellaceae bacterium]
MLGTVYARSATVPWQALLFALLLSGFAYSIVSINRAWRGIWRGVRRNSLNLTVMWASLGLILIVGHSLPDAQRQAVALAALGLFLTPWGAHWAGWGLRLLAATRESRLDWGKALFMAGLLAGLGSAVGHRGPIPHVQAAGMTLPLHDVMRWLVTAAFTLYVARRPVLDRRMQITLTAAFGLVSALFFASGERYSVVLVLLVTAVVGVSTWGLRRTLPSVALLMLLGLVGVLILGKFGHTLPQDRLAAAVGMRAQNDEIQRARLALSTSGWSGVSGVHLERMSFQSVTDYALSSLALNYGRLGLGLALAITFVQICLLFLSTAQLDKAASRLLGLALVANIGVQATLPILAMTPFPAPYGGIPWALAARSVGQVVLQTLASAALTGAVPPQQIEER